MFAELNMLWELGVVGFERLNPLMSRTRVRGFLMPAHFHTAELIPAPPRGCERSCITATLQMGKQSQGGPVTLLGHRTSKRHAF